MITSNDEAEAIRNLNPATDKLGRDADFKDAVCARLNALEVKVREMELIIEEQRKLNESKSENN